jgi:hypothetical protein
MGRDFWTPLRKPSKLAPFMTMLGGLWKTIAEHTAAKAGAVSYVPSQPEELGWDVQEPTLFSSSSQ